MTMLLRAWLSFDAVVCVGAAAYVLYLSRVVRRLERERAAQLACYVEPAGPYR